MATSTTSPFTLAAVNAMRRLYPESMADKSFDNTGLLLESPINEWRPSKLRNSVLLTIDLTAAVATEAIQREVSLVVAYHPIIFRGLKSITAADSQQRSLLRLAAEGISVYCPHSAVDAVDGGNADWLADLIVGRIAMPKQARTTEYEQSAGYMFHKFPSGNTDSISDFDEALPALTHERTPIAPAPTAVEGSSAGMGRYVRLYQEEELESILMRLLHALHKPAAVKVALPYPGNTRKPSDIKVKSFAVCAGSGGSVFSKISEQPELLITGEMSHHEVLAATERGQTVICLDHSNSERGYLASVMQPRLRKELQLDWKALDVDVEISHADRDPFLTLVNHD